MTNTEIFKYILNQEELSWENMFFEIDFEIIMGDKDTFNLMYLSLNKIYMEFLKAKVELYDLDNFVNLCRKMTELCNLNIEHLDTHIYVKGDIKYDMDGVKNILYGTIITFLDYNKAKVYKHKMMKDGKYYFYGKTFDTFKQLYLFTQNIISIGGHSAFYEHRDSSYMLDLLNTPCKL